MTIQAGDEAQLLFLKGPAGGHFLGGEGLSLPCASVSGSSGVALYDIGDIDVGASGRISGCQELAQAHERPPWWSSSGPRPQVSLALMPMPKTALSLVAKPAFSAIRSCLGAGVLRTAAAGRAREGRGRGLGAAKGEAGVWRKPQRAEARPAFRPASSNTYSVSIRLASWRFIIMRVPCGRCTPHKPFLGGVFGQPSGGASGARRALEASLFDGWSAFTDSSIRHLDLR